MITWKNLVSTLTGEQREALVELIRRFRLAVYHDLGVNPETGKTVGQEELEGLFTDARRCLRSSTLERETATSPQDSMPKQRKKKK